MKSILKNTLKILGVSALLASGANAGMMGGTFGVGVQLFGGAFKTDAGILGDAASFSYVYKDHSSITSGAAGAGAANAAIATSANGKDANKTFGSQICNMSGDNYSTPWGVGVNACYMFDFGMIKVGPRVAFDYFFTDAKEVKTYETTGSREMDGLASQYIEAIATGIPGALGGVPTASKLTDGKMVGVKNSWQVRAYVHAKHCSGFGVFGGVHWSKTTGFYGETDLESANTLSFAFGLGGMSKITSNIAAFFNAGYKIDLAGTEIDFTKSNLYYTTSARQIARGLSKVKADETEQAASATGNLAAPADHDVLVRVTLPLGAEDVLPKLKADGDLEAGSQKATAFGKHKIKRNGFFGEVGFNFMF